MNSTKKAYINIPQHACRGILSLIRIKIIEPVAATPLDGFFPILSIAPPPAVSRIYQLQPSFPGSVTLRGLAKRIP